MHKSAEEAGAAFFEVYLDASHQKILDIGAQDVNGSLRKYVGQRKYTGLDIAQAPGVDVVCAPGDRFPFDDNSFDAAVSVSCFEHDQCFWATFMEIIRVLRPGGLFFLDAPSNGIYHGYPFDNWRFYPDAGRALVEWARRNNVFVRLVESGTLRQNDDMWNDFIAVFQKAPFSANTAHMLDKFPDATNIRWEAGGELHNITIPTQDLESIASLRGKIAELNAELGRSQKEIEKLTGRPWNRLHQLIMRLVHASSPAQ